MKQPVVEFLVEKLKSQGLLIGEPDNLVAVRQAKEMEKQQKYKCVCDDKQIGDFEDNEIMAELTNRNLLGYTDVNSFTLDLFNRFSRLINFADHQELDTVIKELETKYKL